MPSKTIVAVAVATLIAAAFSVTAAEANKAQQTRYYTSNTDPPSLDGRVLGYPRTCGSNTFQYDSSGSTVGPYCH